MNNKTSPVLIPLPNNDFDPTEVSISWKVITDAGYKVVFATKDGQQAKPDAMMLSGEGLDFWGFIPGLKKITVVGRVLRANKVARAAHLAMSQDSNFLNPVSFDSLKPSDFSGLILPGGHASGMIEYLEDEVLQRFVADFFDHKSGNTSTQNLPNLDHPPIGAICHGVILAARSTSKISGRSALFGRKTTALTWTQELAAQNLTRFTRFWDPLYYRTYSESSDEAKGYWSVESEVKRAIKNDSDFLQVPSNIEDYKTKTNNIARDTIEDSRPAWVVKDHNYISARWPGDAHTFAKTFVDQLSVHYKQSR